MNINTHTLQSFNGIRREQTLKEKTAPIFCATLSGSIKF